MSVVSPAQDEIFWKAHELHEIISRWMKAVEADRPTDFASSYEWIVLHQQLSALGIVSAHAHSIPNALNREYAPLPYNDADELSRIESSACDR